MSALTVVLRMWKLYFQHFTAQTVDKALTWQGHNVISHIIVIEAWILTEVFLVVLLSLLL